MTMDDEARAQMENPLYKALYPFYTWENMHSKFAMCFTCGGSIYGDSADLEALSIHREWHISHGE